MFLYIILTNGSFINPGEQLNLQYVLDVRSGLQILYWQLFPNPFNIKLQNSSNAAEGEHSPVFALDQTSEHQVLF